MLYSFVTFLKNQFATSDYLPSCRSRSSNSSAPMSHPTPCVNLLDKPALKPPPDCCDGPTLELKCADLVGDRLSDSESNADANREGGDAVCAGKERASVADLGEVGGGEVSGGV